MYKVASCCFKGEVRTRVGLSQEKRYKGLNRNRNRGIEHKLDIKIPFNF